MQGQWKWGLVVLLGITVGRVSGAAVAAEPPARHVGAALVDAQEIIDKVLTREEGEIVERGSVVLLIERGGPLDRAGLRTADAIVEVAGARVDGTRDLLHILGQRPIGSRLSLTFVRDGAVLATIVEVEGPRYGPVALGEPPEVNRALRDRGM